MSSIFRIPVDNQHFKDTIEVGKSLDEISKFLHGDEKAIITGNSKAGIVRYWGSLPGYSNERNFKILQSGDEVLCYRSGKYIALARVYYKTVNKDLARYSWGETESGNTWEMMYFFDDVTFFQLETNFINNEFGFKSGPVMGFNHISEDKVKTFASKYGSVKNFIDQKGYENKIITSILQDLSDGIIKSPFEAQYYLVDLGNQLEYDTYVPSIDAGHTAFNKKLGELTTIHKENLDQYIAPAIFEPLSNIDVIWFKDNYKPRYFYEVIHKTGMNEAFARLKAVSEYYEIAKPRIIGDKNKKTEFDRSRRLYFPNPDKISYKFYNDLTQVHSESVHYKLLLEKFLD